MQSILLFILVASGAAFILQTVLAFIGLSDELATPNDDSVGFFTIRNMISFLLGFSAAGYLLLRTGSNALIPTLAGVLFGGLLVGVTMGSMKFFMKLEQKNEILPHEYHRIIATVTIKVPRERQGQGKIEFALNERMDEMVAVTDDGEDIPKGSQVQVDRLLDNGVLLVHRLLVN